ncbi:Locomotion-related protein Hikaru genki [Lucilia cuprina]|uniref:Locomotion-related protein Hikaru genki n=1 Tax=Lucilia cuprina TaxID=7375 RepID=A0A0L0CK37_LUCCU|nr:Protein lev-9 [Lucilia cuprina]KNC32615.1 Locomotion-related protein Hikaru genki [Lucilia cuprina]
MNRYLLHILIVTILCYKVLSVPVTPTEIPQDDEDDDWDDDDESSEADDDGRVYKNPRNSPSSDCPRDEEQATLLGQKCLRKCSSDEDCKSKKKKCLCDGVCGMSCIKPDRECPELAQPTLGQVTVGGKHFGARASYSCPHGYHVVGLQSRLCQADGNWAGAEPACKQNIYCLKPPQIEHARNSALPEQETFDLDSTVQYHCHTGYVTNGFPRAKCLAIDGQASWYGPDIQCEPRSCGQPPDPANGWHSGECYTYGCKITYNCGTGYELVGKHERTCQSDGSWTPKELPTCVLVTSVVCPTPENPKNGKATYTTLAYNSVVSYECRYGYTLMGESSSRCGADRKWSGTLPICKEINCGHPGNLYNGWIENIDAGTGLGASIIFRCQPDMLMHGHASSVCQIDGRWRNSLPECLAPCVVPAISQGYVVPIEIITDENGTTIITPTTTTQSTLLQSANVEKVKHGTALDVKCDENYEFPVSLLSPPTCHNGTWSIIPRCVPARCKSMPKPPKHGMVLAPKTEHGMKARFKCKDGFKLVNPEGKDVTDPNDYVLTCSFGNWTGETPHCLEVFCSFPGYIPNGKVLLVGNMGLYDYRPYVKKIVNNKQIMYDCDKGYVLDIGPPGATCVGGKWRPLELPQCLLGQHPRLRWNRRRRSIEMRYLRSSYLMKHKRNLERNLRNEIFKHFPNWNNVLNDDTNKKIQRSKRSPTDIEEAYSKYYERIKQKYHDFVKYLLGYNNGLYNSMDLRNPSKKLRVHNGRWYYITNETEPNPKYKVLHKSRAIINDFNLNEYDELDNKAHRTVGKIPLPNMYDNSQYTTLRRTNEPMIMKSNSYNYVIDTPSRNFKSSNDSDFIEQLKAQIIRKRKKRSSSYPTDTDTDPSEQYDNKEGRKRIRGPCEDLVWDSFANVTVVRPGKVPGRNSVGIILSLECNAGFKLNIKGENATARCIRGIWKPETPKCISAPCLVPSVENGKYYKVEPHTTELSDKPSLTPLSTYEEIQSNEFITLECEEGFKIEGSAQLRCAHGSWSVKAFSECVSVACTLPNITGLIYEGGYRAGLTIGHGSSVYVRCNHSSSTLPIEMTCSKGVINPQNIHCETGMRKSREEIITDSMAAESKENEDNSIDLSHTLDTSDMEEESNSTDDHNDESKMCGPPTMNEGALIYVNDKNNMKIERIYESGTEIYFNCIPSASGERNTWKIICENGQWIGRSYNCANGTCLFRNNEPNVVSFYNDLEIREDVVEFPPGATITSRCTDIGKFELIGSIERTCIHSEWTGTKPQCFGLNQENDYAMEKAPTILFRRQNGPIAQSNDGKLIVYPGTTLHMECLWMRRFGNPKWSVSHDYKNYSEGWVTEEGRDATLEYRLTISDAQTDDSGTYSCETPARHKHSVEVVVKSINCPEIPTRRGLIVNTNETKLSTRVLMSCSNGNSLIGASELFCLPSGNWSAPLPVCESVECGDIPLPNNISSPRVSVLSREVGGRAAFSCSSGYGLRGPSEAICMPSGEWATPFPTCVEVQCDNPGAPQNGYAQGQAPYRAGDVVQFNCNPEYMMQGQPIIACQDNGRWSGGLPKCVQACSYPGTAISGHMSSVQFYYAIGESITFTCDAGLELRGPKMVKCLKNGKWSGAIPQCVTTD